MESGEDAAKKARLDDRAEVANESGPQGIPQVFSIARFLLVQSVKEYREPLSPSHRLLRSAGKYHLLIGVTASVASIKLRELTGEIYRQASADKVVIKVKILRLFTLAIQVVATPNALNFFNPVDLNEEVFDDRDEWSMWQDRGDPVLHIGKISNPLLNSLLSFQSCESGVIAY